MMTRIIAEAGVNHNGDIELAKALIDVARDAGADSVKFQTFNAAALVTESAQQASYQSRNTGLRETQYEMLKRLELSRAAHHELSAYCERAGIEFLSSAFDVDSLNFLVNEVGVGCLKVASGELTNAPFLLAHAQTGKDLIVSTGMSDLIEIEQALGVIAFGLLHQSIDVNPGAFKRAYQSTEGQRSLQQKVTLLHCTSDYPAKPDEINLTAMQTLQETFKLPVGYSDHSAGTTIPTAAAAMGACVIEKHFTLDRNLPGPDHKASLEPAELKNMVEAIRVVEAARGDGSKQPMPSELETRQVARKSLVASRPIVAGQTLTADDIAVKRPGTGMSPFSYWDLIGRTSRHDYEAGELLRE